MANYWRPMDAFWAQVADERNAYLRKAVRDHDARRAREGGDVPSHFIAFGHSDEQPVERWATKPAQDVTFSTEATQREYDRLTRREVNQWQFMRWCVQHGVITEGE